jgi:hypothetical protein
MRPDTSIDKFTPALRVSEIAHFHSLQTTKSPKSVQGPRVPEGGVEPPFEVYESSVLTVELHRLINV